MKVVPLLVTALAASAGCGSDPFTVVVRAENVSLLAYRDGGGTWTQLDASDTFRARIEITEGRYSLAWVCGAVSSTTHILHSTLADEPLATCFPGLGGGGASQLFGMTAPRATVHVGAIATTADAAGFYGMTVDAGVHDVVAITEDNRIYIEHDVDLSTSRELELLVDTLGVPMETRTAEVRGTQQTAFVSSKLVTRNHDVVTLGGSGSTVPVPPASALAAHDVVLVSAVGEECDAQAPIGDGTPVVDLPDPPRPVVADRQLTWSSDVEWDVIDMSAFGGPGGLQIGYQVRATRDWMAEADTDAVELPDPRQLPGWEPSWGAFSDREQLSFTLQVEHGRKDGAHSSCDVPPRTGDW